MFARIQFKALIGLTYLILYSLLFWNCNPQDQEQTSRPLPNIVLIVADDLGYGDLSIYGQQFFDTPNIDRLAAQGIKFTQHYAGSTVCAPSRSSLMTGLHTGKTPIRGNIGVNDGQFPLPSDIETFPKILKAAGYVNGAFGKWGLGYPGSTGDPLNQGFDTFFGYNSQTIAHNYYPWELQDDDQNITIEENEGTKKGLYAPDLIHERTLKFIEDHQDTTFFLFVPSIIPHAEMVAPDEYMDKFIQKTTVEPPHKPISRFEPEPYYEGVDDIEHHRYKKGAYGSQAMPRAAFAAMVTLLDDQVGEILDKLEELGIAENTLVIFTSDNGPHKEGGADPDFFNSNGPFQGHKRDLYEGGIRVPMIASWPGRINSGTESDHPSAFWDFLPTFADIIERHKPANIDGISFLPTLEGSNQPTHEFFYWEFHEEGGKQAIRKCDWKAIRLNVMEDAPSPTMLFDLSNDPGETIDLAENHPELVKEMERLFMTERTEDKNWPFLQE